MDKLKYGYIMTFGITTSGFISIEFYDPGQQDGRDTTVIYLTIKQAKLISKLGEIIDVKTT